MVKYPRTAGNMWKSKLPERFAKQLLLGDLWARHLKYEPGDVADVSPCQHISLEDRKTNNELFLQVLSLYPKPDIAYSFVSWRFIVSQKLLKTHQASKRADRRGFKRSSPEPSEREEPSHVVPPHSKIHHEYADVFVWALEASSFHITLVMKCRALRWRQRNFPLQSMKTNSAHTKWGNNEKNTFLSGGEHLI